LDVLVPVRIRAPQLTISLQFGGFPSGTRTNVRGMGWTPRYTEDEVRAAVANAHSMSEALRRLELRPAGGNHRTLKKLVAYYDISIDHFDPNWALRYERPRKATPLQEILVEHSTYHRGHLKRRLYDQGLKRRQCELCGQGETWCGRAMALILDHINGMPTDNRLENLRIVCPNCAATLDTHCGRKNRQDVEPLECVHCGKDFLPKYARQRYCSQTCGVHSKGPRNPKPETRKVPRPSYQQLMADVQSMSYLAIGRKYGVSDRAVRKWIRWYEYQREMESGERKPAMDDQAA